MQGIALPFIPREVCSHIASFPTGGKQKELEDKIMKRPFHSMLFGAIFLAALARITPAAQAAQCSQAGSAGDYGFTISGFVILPTGAVPLAAVGKATIDAVGNATGTEARSVGGGYADETFTGTFAVNADCTGTATLKFYEGGQLVRTSVLATVTDSNGREIRMVQKSLQLPNGAFLPVVITVEVRRMSSNED
jgi:hypothetical protein